MAVSTSKRVVAVRFDREALPGFVDPNTYLQPAGVELLSPAGSVTVVAYTEIKAICFVRDFESFNGWKRDRLFAARPKSEGLWVRFRLRDGDQIDGVLPANLLAWDLQGFTIAPPDPNFLNQRVFIPRAAVSETEVLGVAGTQARRKRAQREAEGQIELFEK